MFKEFPRAYPNIEGSNQKRVGTWVFLSFTVK